MNEDRVQRRLTTILAADVAGYSRLMGVDEEGTLAALKAHRRELIDPKIAEHRGRVVKTTGDGLLVEFPSVVDAVRCSVEVQRGMALRNETVPVERRLEFRMGVNVGDVIIDEDGDIFGDGVNVAARLEGLADPGGIVVSRSVRDYVRDKLSFDFEDMGERRVKNIARPVEVHRVRYGGGEMNALAEAAHLMAPARPQPPQSRRWPLWAGAAAVALAAAGGAGYQFLANRPPPAAPAVVAAAPEPAAPEPVRPPVPVAVPAPLPVPAEPPPAEPAPAPAPAALAPAEPPPPPAVPAPPPAVEPVVASAPPAAPPPAPLPAPLSLLPPPSAPVPAPLPAPPPAAVPVPPPAAQPLSLLPPPTPAPAAPATGVAAAASSVRQSAVGVAAVEEETPAPAGASAGVEAVVRWGSRAVAEAPAAASLCAAGRKVEVLWEQQWWPATVRAAAQPDGRCPVRYDGYGAEYDESVPPHRLRAKGR